MKHGLLVITAVLALAIGAPAYAQYMYIDVNGDAANTAADVLSSSVTSVDVYLITNKSLSDPNDLNSALVDQTCSFGPYDLNMNSYNIILTCPSGGVAYGTWVNSIADFTIDTTTGTSGNDAWIGRAGAVFQAPGAYKLGSMPVTVTGTPQLTFAVSTTGYDGAMTAFGSNCIGSGFDNTMRYGSDWMSIGPTRSPTPVTETTWGKIKALYR